MIRLQRFLCHQNRTNNQEVSDSQFRAFVVILFLFYWFWFTKWMNNSDLRDSNEIPVYSLSHHKEYWPKFHTRWKRWLFHHCYIFWCLYQNCKPSTLKKGNKTEFLPYRSFECVLKIWILMIFWDLIPKKDSIQLISQKLVRISFRRKFVNSNILGEVQSCKIVNERFLLFVCCLRDFHQKRAKTWFTITFWLLGWFQNKNH